MPITNGHKRVDQNLNNIKSCMTKGLVNYCMPITDDHERLDWF